VEIAVVGASVRGSSLLERLLAVARDGDIPGPVRIRLFDPHPPGSGRIWRAGQPQTLIMNTVAAQSTVFPDESVRVAGSRLDGPTLAEWCRQVTADPTSADLPASVAAEAASTGDASNPSRLLYGYYLRWAFERIAASAPPGVEVEVIADRVDDLVPDAGGWILTATSGQYRADAVILALGWLDRADVVRHSRVIAPGNPIDQDLTAIRAGERVAVRGLGMNFFDVVSLLTEARGGRFSDDLSRYLPSGEEPVILAGSSRGVPYRAKPDFGAPPPFPAQRILRAALPSLLARRPVDFTLDVLPLIERDAHYDYAVALADTHPDKVHDLEGFLHGLTAGDDPATRALVHIPAPEDRLDLARAADPFVGVATAPENVDAAVASLVRADAAEAAVGGRSALKAALHSYAAARGALIDLVGFGGLTPTSFDAYRRFLSVAASFGSGPPLRRTRHLLALHEAGIVLFTGPGFSAVPDDDGVRVRARFSPEVTASRLIDAWLPTPTVTRTADPLLASLVSRGIARPWRHADGSPSDAVDVRPIDGEVVSDPGHRGLFSVGVPHEDIRVFTIIAPVPGTDSSVLRETDAAARAAVRYATSRRLSAATLPREGHQE